MPANLTPVYYEAEDRFRKAATNEEKIAALEEMLAVMPKHKGTDGLRADLRRKLSQLKEAATPKKAASTRTSSTCRAPAPGRSSCWACPTPARAASWPP